MPSNFPGAIDSFTDPLANSSLASPSHSTLHSDINDAVEKVEQYMGLVKVIPTAATNGTINATTGTVTVGNAVSSVTVTCFSALYDNYVITWQGSASSTSNIYCQLGSTTTGYYGVLLWATPSAPTPAGAGNNNTANWSYVGDTTSNGGRMSFTLFSPNLAARTSIAAPYMGTGTSSGAFGHFSGNLDNATQYTAFTFGPGVGTITGGSLRIYGYRN